jgi:hypothetical protein
MKDTLRRGASIPLYNNLKNIFKLSLYVCCIFAVACSKESLKDLNTMTILNVKTTMVTADFCTTPANQVKSRLKFIFVIDKSGSNKEADPSIPNSTASDPDGNKRYMPIKAFIDSNPEPENSEDKSVLFSLVNFSSEAKIVLKNGKQFMQKTDFKNLIESEHHPAGSLNGLPFDEGATNYMDALKNTKSLIDSDIEAARKEAAITGEVVSSYYIVFFVSDGFPMVNQKAQNTQDILLSIQGIKSLEDKEKSYVDAIQVNTAYYYQSAPDPTASSLLESMALPSAGAGESLVFGAGEQIDFSKFSVPVRKVRHILKDVFVTNINTLWDNDHILRDSDADSLPDSKEISLGSDPKDPDSDKNGVPDGVEYIALGRPCKNVSCASVGHEEFPQCDAIVEGRDSDVDHDGLSNCSEKILGAKWDDFDSNEDWIPELLAFNSNIGFLPGTIDVNLDSDKDGIRTYDEVKEFTPPNFDNNHLLDMPRYNYSLVKVSQDDVQDCYKLRVDGISTTSETDGIRIYLLEGSSVIETKKNLRTANKNISVIGENLVFVNEDFK